MSDLRTDRDLEWGWRLQGEDGQGEAIDITIGETELSRAEAGITVGRHPMLCEYVIANPTVSRRHFRLSRSVDGLLIEDVNSLNGTRLDGLALTPFEPVVVDDGQQIRLGDVRLVVHRLSDAG